MSDEPQTKKQRTADSSHTSPSKAIASPNGNGKKSALDQLKTMNTIIVADTGEFSSIKKYSPEDATTNPSLILKAAQNKDYHHLISSAIEYGLKRKEALTEKQLLELIMDKLSVNFGVEILKSIPGYVSIEVDARLSFDKEGTLHRARQIISLLEEMGVEKSRVLIKVASTYEGIMAAKVLEGEDGVHCNCTLIFSLIQAVLCAENGITLISPFVGRILDWFKAKTGQTYDGSTDPGVLSVKNIYQYFKKHNYSTIVMGRYQLTALTVFGAYSLLFLFSSLCLLGCFSFLLDSLFILSLLFLLFRFGLGASFRNIGEIIALAGCDRLTIAPSLLEELQSNYDSFERQLEPSSAAAAFHGDKIATDEASFRYQLNEDAMATEKLAEGIRSFAADIIKLENIVKEKLKEKK
jgi:transaldolase